MECQVEAQQEKHSLVAVAAELESQALPTHPAVAAAEPAAVHGRELLDQLLRQLFLAEQFTQSVRRVPAARRPLMVLPAEMAQQVTAMSLRAISNANHQRIFPFYI